MSPGGFRDTPHPSRHNHRHSPPFSRSDPDSNSNTSWRLFSAPGAVLAGSHLGRRKAGLAGAPAATLMLANTGRPHQEGTVLTTSAERSCQGALCPSCGCRKTQLRTWELLVLSRLWRGAGLSKPRFRKGRKRTEASLEKWAVTLGLETWVRKRPSFSLTLEVVRFGEKNADARIVRGI